MGPVLTPASVAISVVGYPAQWTKGAGYLLELTLTRCQEVRTPSLNFRTEPVDRSTLLLEEKD